VRAGSLLSVWNAGGMAVVFYLTNSHRTVGVFRKKNVYFFGKERAAQNDLLVSTY